ncbi:hypothetical protein LGN04_28820 [Burkholderia multivorans]|uniref:Uncharacterized protein n=1 Tax=Ralstonia insidiosa TaxID=190721 RepID=A0A191ZVY9_9RALS|nr:hypothetical protein [Ralstonia insidiosa]ANJ72269.1 hypothetical protein A9Y76_07220 [Ralstonia insidiosa]MCA8457911.1 hypothetical protein [Burkholderia multivorans]
MNTQIAFDKRSEFKSLEEKKTARIEILTQPTIKQLAKEKAERENKDLSKILNSALIEFLAN